MQPTNKKVYCAMSLENTLPRLSKPLSRHGCPIPYAPSKSDQDSPPKYSHGNTHVLPKEKVHADHMASHQLPSQQCCAKLDKHMPPSRQDPPTDHKDCGSTARSLPTLKYIHKLGPTHQTTTDFQENNFTSNYIRITSRLHQ